MPHLEAGDARAAASGFADADAFCLRVAASSLFAASEPVAVARAPGRLDVLGGIADYSGSLVLALPLAAAALAAAQIRPDGLVVAVSGDRRIALAADDLVGAPARGPAPSLRRRRRVGRVRSRPGRPVRSGGARDPMLVVDLPLAAAVARFAEAPRDQRCTRPLTKDCMTSATTITAP